MKRRVSSQRTSLGQWSRLGRISQAQDGRLTGVCERDVENLHSPSKSTQRGRIARPLWFYLLPWLRGLDLNQRPLGYEGKSSRDTSRDKPTAAGELGIYASGVRRQPTP